MPTRNVVLTDHHEEVIDRLVKSGRYQNASEVMREGLRMVEQREEREAAKLKALREAANVGLADLDEGRYLDFASVDELEEHLAR
ncbi:type II toxin-antitoxin system ParD family antitoxin, partial [Rhizobiaceae sp. 2RAB30]